MPATTTRRKLPPPEVAELWGISHDKVLGWIRSGELRAINAVARRGGRPRYLIDEADLEAFEQRRAVVATPAVERTRSSTSDVKDYF